MSPVPLPLTTITHFVNRRLGVDGGKVNGGRVEVRVSELLLDVVQWNAFFGHFHGTGVTERVRVNTIGDARVFGVLLHVNQDIPDVPASPVHRVNKERALVAIEAKAAMLLLKPQFKLVAGAMVEPDNAGLAALAALHHEPTAVKIDIRLFDRHHFRDAQLTAPHEQHGDIIAPADEPMLFTNREQPQNLCSIHRLQWPFSA